MILTRYLFKRLFLYFFMISSSLAIIYNLVEFFEKLMRVQQSSVLIIISFVIINIIPTFFELIPISSWIASCLLIREIYERGEWETILLLGISPLRLLQFFLIGGIAIGSLSFIGKEIIVSPIIEKVEVMRLEEFKHGAHIMLYNQWITQDASLFIHFDSLNINTGQGKNITLLYFQNNFTIEKEITAPDFEVKLKSNTIILPNGFSFYYDSASKESFSSLELSVPSLFLYLQTVGGTKRLIPQIRSLINAYHSPIPYFFNQELGTFLERLLKHLQPIFYYVVTIFFFLSFFVYERLRWFVILLPYPYLLISTNATIFLVRHNNPAWILCIPYCIMIACIVLFAFSSSFISIFKVQTQIEKK